MQIHEDVDAFFMAKALREAQKAAKKREVPIGAVMVMGDEVVSRAHNLRESGADPLAHAEMIVLRRASRRLKSWRLADTTLYVTLEPCLMCMGTIMQARVPRLVFAAFDPKAGACGSIYDVSNDPRLNHRVSVTSRVMELEATKLLKDFFKALRIEKRQAGKGL